MTTAPPDTIAVLKVPALLSVRSVAGILDVSPRTVRRRIEEGDLRAVREGDRVMVRADELRAYVDRLERVGRKPGRAPRRGPPPRFDFLR